MLLHLRLPLVLALGLCASSIMAQDEPAQPQHPPSPPARQAPKPPPPTGSIHGFVYCGDTHKPARGAAVMALEIPSASKEPHNSNPRFARTAMDGSYTIPNATEGEYGVAAFLPGYLSAFDNLSADDVDGNNDEAAMMKRVAAAGTVTVTAHQTASHDITLTRGATVSGRVLFSDGSPASQINISVEDINAKPHHSKPGQPEIDMGAFFTTLLTHQTNATDDEGRFRISGLSPATYRVAAISASTLALDGDDGDGMASLFGSIITDPSALHVYSGDTTHKNEAKTYELRPGDNVSGVDIVIPLNAFHQVRGLLSAVDGRTINTAELTLVDTTDDSLHFNAKLAADGVFIFPTVPSGTYKLSATGAQIMEADANTPPRMFNKYGAPMHPVAAFADANTTLIVKDTDLLDVSLPLTEIPLPVESKPGAPPAPVPPQ